MIHYCFTDLITTPPPTTTAQLTTTEKVPLRFPSGRLRGFAASPTTLRISWRRTTTDQSALSHINYDVQYKVKGKGIFGINHLTCRYLPLFSLEARREAKNPSLSGKT